MIVNTNNLTETLYANLTEYDIFCYVLGIDINKLHSLIKYNKRFKVTNETKSLDCGFTFSKRRNGNQYLYLKCFSNDLYSGDCLYHAGLKFNLDTRIGADFVETVKRLLDLIPTIKQHIPKDFINNLKVDYKDYRLTYRDFNQLDYNYFYKYKLKPIDVKLNYQCISSIFDNVSHRTIYNYKPYDACYSYITFKHDTMGNVSRKLYFPYRTNHKFMIINGGVIFEDNNLFNPNNRGKTLIITKSHKDKFILRNALKELEVKNTYVTNVASESSRYDEEIPQIYTMYDRAYTMYDVDKTGIYYSAYYKKLGIPSLLPNHGTIYMDIPNEIKKIKDYSDLTAHNPNLALEILNDIINQIQ